MAVLTATVAVVSKVQALHSWKYEFWKEVKKESMKEIKGCGYYISEDKDDVWILKMNT